MRHKKHLLVAPRKAFHKNRITKKWITTLIRRDKAQTTIKEFLKQEKDGWFERGMFITGGNSHRKYLKQMLKETKRSILETEKKRIKYKISIIKTRKNYKERFTFSSTRGINKDYAYVYGVRLELPDPIEGKQ